MLSIMLEIPSILNQMFEKLWKVIHLKYLVIAIKDFVKTLGFSFELIGFCLKKHICPGKAQKVKVQVRSYTCHVTPYPLYVSLLVLDDPTLPICIHTTRMSPNYEK